MTKLRIKLDRDLPVAEEHGVVAGREFDVVLERVFTGRTLNTVCWGITGDAGEKVWVFGAEATVIEASKEPCPVCDEPCKRSVSGNGWECRQCNFLFSPLAEED